MAKLDVLVVGLGVQGSAVAAASARRGLRVVGVDAAPENEVWGASAGPWRMLREHDPGHAHLDSLARDARHRWQELAIRHGVELIVPATALVVERAPSGGRAASDRRLAGLADHLQAAGAVADAACALLNAPTAVRTLRADAVAAGARLHHSQSFRPRFNSKGQLELALDGQSLRPAIVLFCLGARVVELPPALRPLGVHTEVAFMQTAHRTQADLEPDCFYVLPSGSDRFCLIPRPGLLQFGHFAALPGGAAAARRRDQAALRQLAPGLTEVGLPATAVAAYTHTESGGFELHWSSATVAALVACSAVGFKYAPALAERVVDRIVAGVGPLATPVDSPELRVVTSLQATR